MLVIKQKITSCKAAMHPTNTVFCFLQQTHHVRKVKFKQNSSLEN